MVCLRTEEATKALSAQPEPEQRSASTRLPLAATVVLTATAYASFSQGGFYAHQFRMVVLLLGLGFGASVVARPLRWSELHTAPVMSCGAFAAAAMASGVASGDPWGATPVIILVVALGAVVLTVRRLGAAQRYHVAVGLVAIGVVVALSGWAGVAWRLHPYALPGQGLWRGATSVTYANAAAGLLVPLALLALARVAAGTQGRIALLTPYLLLVGVGATLSRGGLLALGVGGMVLAAVVGARRALSLLPPAIGAVVALAFLAPSFPADLPPRPGLALAGLVAGGAVSIAGLRPNAWRAVAAFAAVGLVAMVGLVGADRFGKATSAVAAARVTTGSHDRLEGTEATLRLAATRPVLGVGPGHFSLHYRSHDGTTLRSSYTHNEYLQVLAQQGAVGLGVLVAGLISTALALVRSRPRDPWLWPAAVAALGGLGVHSSVDFLWHVPVIPLVGAVMLGLALPLPAPAFAASSPPGNSHEE